MPGTFSVGFVFHFLSAFAQDPGVIAGIVRDPADRPIPGAKVALYQTGRHTPEASTVTAADGSYRFDAGYRGSVLLTVSADGFRAATVPSAPGTASRVVLKIAGLDQQVLVTAEGSAQSVDQVSKSASLVTAAEIEQRGEYSVTEALRDTPGLLIRNLGGPGQSTTIRMRGLRADATAILIDGLRFRDAATTQGDASSFISTLNVIRPDRIEVLRGSGSSLYGTNAVGGTINVVSDPGGGPMHGNLLMEGGSLGFLRGRGAVSGGLAGNRLTYSAGLLHLNVLSGVDGDDRARSSGLQSFVRYTPGSRTSLSSRLIVSDDFVQPNLSPTATGLPAANIPSTTIVRAIPLAPEEVRKSALGLPFSPGNSTFIPNRNDADNRRASRFWSGAWIARRNVSAALDLQASYQHVHTDRDFQNGPAGVGTQPRLSNLSLFQGSIDTVDGRVNGRPGRNTTLLGGFEFEREGYLNADDNRLPAPSTVTTRTRANQRSYAGYFAAQTALLNQRLQLSLSGRAQSFATGRPTFAYAGVSNNYDAAASTSPPRALTGDFAASYFAARTGTKLRAHFGNSYRAPGLYERYGSGFFYNAVTNAVVFTPYGDPRLAPDRYNSADAGIDQYLLRDRIRISATWFYTRIAQITQFDSVAAVIAASSDPFGRTSGYYNGAGGISRGAEAAAEFRPWRSTLWRGSYTYVNADTDQDTAVRGFYRALSVPAHSFTAFWNQRLNRRAELTFDLYRSGAYHNSLSAAGRARAYLYPGYVKADGVLSIRLRETDRYALNWRFKVDNILNRRYFENGFQSPRATLVTGLDFQFH